MERLTLCQKNPVKPRGSILSLKTFLDFDVITGSEAKPLTLPKINRIESREPEFDYCFLKNIETVYFFDDLYFSLSNAYPAIWAMKIDEYDFNNSSSNGVDVLIPYLAEKNEEAVNAANTFSNCFMKGHE